MRILVLAAFLLGSHGAWATAQIPEVLELNGKPNSLFSEPFTFYLAAHPSEIPKLERVATDRCTGSWRGYQGHWFIREQKLYLRSLFANPCRDKPEPIPLRTFFPGREGPVQAEWYTGKLVVPLGKRVSYVHLGYESEYERYLVISVERGRILSQETTSQKPK